MNKRILVLAAAVVLPALPGAANAELGFNIGAVTDYRFRGISQTRLKPALQGGIDYSAGGFYAGAWASTIKWIEDAGGDADVEVDVYGGLKGEISQGLDYDVGVLTYQYPSNDLRPSANTTEIYGALSHGVFTVKYSHGVTNLFGFADSKNSGYLDLGASLDIGGGWTVTPHIGHQRIRNNGQFAYWDYALTAGRNFSGVDLSASIVGTDTDDYVGAHNKNLGKTALVLGAKFGF